MQFSDDDCFGEDLEQYHSSVPSSMQGAHAGSHLARPSSTGGSCVASVTSELASSTSVSVSPQLARSSGKGARA
eukprot:1906998-Pyramimonas_sp.AAC.1